MPIIGVPPPLRGPTRGQDRIEVVGKTVRECLDAVDARFPGFAEQLFDAEGRVHRFVKLFLNGAPLAGGALDTSVSGGDEVRIIAAVGGG